MIDRTEADKKLDEGDQVEDGDLRETSRITLPEGWTYHELADVFGGNPKSGIQPQYIQRIPGRIVKVQGGGIDTNLGWKGIKQQLSNQDKKRGANEGETQGDYSFWEYIPGRNLAVCRDSTDKNIFYVYRQGDSPWTNAIKPGTKYQNDLEFQNYPYGCVRIDRREMGTEYSKYVDFYLRVADLPAFKEGNAAIVEIQEDKKGELYFLQYFPTHDYTDAWTLERLLGCVNIKLSVIMQSFRRGEMKRTLYPAYHIG